MASAAILPHANAKWILYPPQFPSTSNNSPTINKLRLSFDSIVLLSISSVLIPPAVTIASSIGLKAFKVNSKFFKSAYLDNVFNLLNKKGINIYMDDFSMGHTAIIFLQHNHFDYVKLDGSLVKDIRNPRSHEIINSIIKLGKSLGFKVIAEFVENESQREELKEMGCDIYQGFLYYKPLNINDLLEVLKKENKDE